MANDTDKIISAIDRLYAKLDDHEMRIRKIETAVIRGGTILALLITSAGYIGTIIVNKLDALTKWWSSQ